MPSLNYKDWNVQKEERIKFAYLQWQWYWGGIIVIFEYSQFTMLPGPIIYKTRWMFMTKYIFSLLFAPVFYQVFFCTSKENNQKLDLKW